MEKLVQSSPALAVDCWMIICPGAVVCTVAWPLVFTGPVGSAKLSGAATSRHIATLMGVSSGVKLKAGAPLLRWTA